MNEQQSSCQQPVNPGSFRGPKGSGRTHRMLLEAIDVACSGTSVTVLAVSMADAARLCSAMKRIMDSVTSSRSYKTYKTLGSNYMIQLNSGTLVMFSSVSGIEFNWATFTLPHFSGRIFVDHFAMETRHNKAISRIAMETAIKRSIEMHDQLFQEKANQNERRQ